MTARKTASPRIAGAVLAIALGLWGLSPSTGWCQLLTQRLTAEDVASRGRFAEMSASVDPAAEWLVSIADSPSQAGPKPPEPLVAPLQSGETLKARLLLV